MYYLSSRLIQFVLIKFNTLCERLLLLNTRLKDIRNYFNLDQQEMADNFNVPLTTYRSYEQGKRNLSLELIEGLCERLNINLNWLICGQGDIFLTSYNCKKKDNSNIVKNIDTFYKRFNQLQKENDLNDYQLSKETGIAEERIEKLGIGKVQPSLEDLKALKSHFDVSIDWLLFGDTPCQQPQNDNTTLSPDEISILKKMAQQFTK